MHFFRISKSSRNRLMVFSICLAIFGVLICVLNPTTNAWAATPGTPDFTEVKPVLEIPIPNLSFTSILRTSDNKYLFISYLSEYIKAFYSYLVGIAGILAISMIMYQGIKWIFAAGDSAKISAAKEGIGQAVMGLILALGSYLILFTINPDLVTFKSLKLLFIDRNLLPEIDLGDVIFDGSPRPNGGTDPSWNANTFNCNAYPPAAGVADPANEAPIPAMTNITSDTSVLVDKSLIDPLKKVDAVLAQFNQQNGTRYTIYVTSGYRPFKKQADIWCGRDPSNNCFKNNPTNVAVRKVYCAVPGYSNHGLGIAIDVVLLKDGKQITNVDSNGQCSIATNIVFGLGNFFYNADTGWKRYQNEIWHYEYKPTQPLRDYYRTMPPRCQK